ncbi:MAG: VCBS repeat-containing protein [Planctomycetes bacterium]|nr:VCBS repeat-containing protein [Planctomycetota bacterium]
MVWPFASLQFAISFISSWAGAQIDFEQVSYYPTVSEVTDLHIGPMNQDRFADVVTVERIGIVTYFASLGDGILSRIATFETIGDGPTAVDCADLDGDTLWDVVWVNDWTWNAYSIHQRIPLSESELVKYTSDFFQATDVVLADLAGDGLPEMAVATGNVASGYASLVVLANIDGYPGERVIHDMKYNYSPALTAADIDQDGDPDLLAICSRVIEGWYVYLYESEVSVFLNDGAGTLEESETPVLLPEGGNAVPTRLAVGDVDNDGDLDLVVLYRDTARNNEPERVMVFMNTGTGQHFEQGQVLHPTTWGHMLELSDLDGDGDLDMLFDGFVHERSQLCIYENAGAGRFQWVMDVPDTGIRQSRALGVRDVNGDGLPDIVLGGESGLAVLLNRSRWLGPSLSHTAFVRGATSELRVESAEPDEAVYFVSSMTEPRILSGVSLLGGLVADVSEPVTLLGMSRADDQGIARLAVHIPAKAPTAVVYTQACIRRGLNGQDSVKTPCLMGRIK